MANQDAPLNTTPYDEDELDHFKQLLQNKKDETKEKIASFKESIDDLTGNKNDESSAAAHHQGDIASEEDEREKFLLMLEKQDDKLEEINAALDRIELGTYGICEDTGAKIQKERLEAIPETRYSMSAKLDNET